MREPRQRANFTFCRTVRLRLVQLAADDGVTMSAFLEGLVKAEDARRTKRAKKAGAA